MSRCGNRYDNAKAESFLKTLKVEAVVYLAAYESFEDVAADLPRFIDDVYNRLSVCIPHSAISALRNSRINTPSRGGQFQLLNLSTPRGALQPSPRPASRAELANPIPDRLRRWFTLPPQPLRSAAGVHETRAASLCHDYPPPGGAVSTGSQDIQLILRRSGPMPHCQSKTLSPP